jgi:hypothetical protein
VRLFFLIAVSVLLAFPGPPPEPAVIEEPDDAHIQARPNSNCQSPAEEWSRYQTSCNNRLEQVI